MCKKTLEGYKTGGRRVGGVKSGQMYDQDERETFHILLFLDYMIVLLIQILFKRKLPILLLAEKDWNLVYTSKIRISL